MPARHDGRLLLLGASTRALAQAALASRHARRAFPGGFVAIDFFGDADLDGTPIETIGVARDAGLPRSVAGLGRRALTAAWSGFLPAGGLENRPGLLRLLAARGRSLGSPAAAVRAARDPARVAAWLAAEGLPHAPVIEAPVVPADGRAWFLKPRRGAGGGRVRRADADERVPPGWFLQERREGRTGSAAFLADGHRARLVGVSEQIAGWRALGGSGFRQGGLLFDATAPDAGPERLLDAAGIEDARRIADGLASRFGLVGLAGFDFVAVAGRPHLIEVNPRWTASMELYDEDRPGSLVDAAILVAEGCAAIDAAAACGLGAASSVAATRGAASPAGAPPVRVRGVLYAVEPVVAPEPRVLAAIGARDRPHAGESIEAGAPICTLTASAESVADARAALEGAATRAYRLCRPTIAPLVRAPETGRPLPA